MLSTKMKKIVLIICWFGKFRNDFEFWLKSVEFNNTIDFLIFTDQTINYVPSNCIIKKCDLEFIETLAKKNVWDGCRISTPYKLCDYRPTFGLLFRDYIQGYDFWGHCDVDMIFGDIRHFFTEERLEKFDRLGLDGPLSVYRNTDSVNRIFFLHDDVKKILSEDKGFGFDEYGTEEIKGLSIYWLNHLRDKLYAKTDFDNLQPYHYSFISCYVENKQLGIKNLMYSFDRGKLYRYGTKNNKLVKEESLYVHIQKRPIEINVPVVDRFVILPPGVITKFVSHIDMNYIKWHVRDGKFWAYYTRFRNKINRIFSRPEWKNTVLFPDQDLWEVIVNE